MEKEKLGIGLWCSILAHVLVITIGMFYGLQEITPAKTCETEFYLADNAGPDTVAQKRDMGKQVVMANRPRAVDRNVESSEAVSQALTASASMAWNAPSVIQKGISESSSADANPTADVRFGSSSGPGFLHRVEPVYPFAAKRMKKEGRVVLRLTIDAHGRLLSSEVVEEAAFGFTEAALEAVKKSTFSPARRNGQAVLSKALLPIRFELK